jgi:hypothetical protein
MKRFLISAVIILLAQTNIVAAASDISSANYYATVRVTNNGTATGNVSVPFAANTSAWISSGLLNASATNIVARNTSGGDASIMPGTSGDPWVLFVEDLPANASIDATVYLGNVTGGKIRTFGTLEIPDTPSLEFGNNFTAPWSGYVDTTVAGNITSKEDAYSRSSDGSGNITFATVDSPQQTEVLAPDGVGSSTNITAVVGAATHWEANLTNDGDTSYVIQNAPGDNWDLYTMANHAVGTGRIDKVVLTMVVKSTAGSSVSSATTLRTESTNYIGADEAMTTDYIAYSTTYVANPNTGVAWTWTEVDDMEAGVNLRYNGGNRGWSTQVYATVYYTASPAATVTVSGVSAGELTIIPQADGTNLWMTVNGSPSANVTFAGVPDNANPTIIGSAATPYWDSFAVTVGGTPIDEWSWQYAATWPGSISGIVGTPTFRTTTSDADVSASLIAFMPVETAAAGENATSTWPEIMTEPPETPANAYSENATPGMFFAPLFNELWSLTGLPSSFLWYNFAFFWILGAGVLVYYIFAKQSINALMVKCIVMGTIMTFFALPGTNIYGLYVVVYWAFWCFGVMVLNKSYGW